MSGACCGSTSRVRFMQPPTFRTKSGSISSPYSASSRSQKQFGTVNPVKYIGTKVMTSSTQRQSSSSTSNQNWNGTTSSAPSTFQLPYLSQAFGGATNALSTAQANGSNAPTDFTAQFTPAMMDAFRSELGYGTNTGVADTSAGIANALAGSGPAATNAGLFGLSQFAPTGGTQYNLNAANQYADNPAFPGMVAGAMRDANQEYTDVQNPAAVRFAAGSGNINSSAPAVQQGIVERGLAQKAGDISATLRGNAFSQGLNLAQNQAAADTQARLGALFGLTNGGNAATNSAIGAGTGSVGQATGLWNIANTGAQNLNAGNQAPLTNAMQAWQFGQNSPFAALNNYWNIVGQHQWGQNSTLNGTQQGTSNGTTTTTPSLLSTISQGVGMLGSF